MADERSLAEAQQRIRRFLRASFGEAATGTGGDLEVRHHGVVAHVVVLTWRGRNALVVLSKTNEGMQLEEGLTRLLATEAHRLPFGQFELFDKAGSPAIWLAHDVLEGDLTRSGLEAIVESVARASAHYGAVVQEWFGGDRPSLVSAGTTPLAPTEAGHDAYSKSVDVIRYRVRGYLEDLDFSFGVDVEGDFVVDIDWSPVVVWVRAFAWTEGRTLVRVWSVTNEGMRIDGELTRFLLATNEDLPFGGFRLDVHGPQTVVAYSLLGETLAQPALENAVRCVADTAEEYGPRIAERFGGRLFTGQ